MLATWRWLEQGSSSLQCYANWGVAQAKGMSSLAVHRKPGWSTTQRKEIERSREVLAVTDSLPTPFAAEIDSFGK